MIRVYYYEKKTRRLFNTIFMAEKGDDRPLSAKQAKRLVQAANGAGRLRRLTEKEYLRLEALIPKPPHEEPKGSEK